MTVPPPLNLDNVQGDILQGFSKKRETFFFFRINVANLSFYCSQLASFLPLVTSATEAKKFNQAIKDAKREASLTGRKPELLEMSAVNIAFSQKGLDVIGIKEAINDQPFQKGMLSDAVGVLGDTLEDWDAKFKEDIHGVFIVAANNEAVLDRTIHKIKHIFRVGHHQAGIIEVTQLTGQSRPDAESGHEHFGFNDGLSQPAVEGVDTKPVSGQETVPQGIALVGRPGDNGEPAKPTVPTGPGISRPSWALDGSFLVFRYLKQLVPEFNAFLEDNALPVSTPIAPGDPTGAELLGARLMGRWKSGAPTEMTPLRDNPALAVPEANQDFAFTPNTNQVRCPYAAHVRKTNPRSDITPGTTAVRRIIRRGIAFGPEVTDEEKAAKKSSDDEKLERGLLFACYQSNIANGFQFLQQSWANNENFPPFKDQQTPGLDPIIGVPIGTAGTRELVGTNPSVEAAGTELVLTAKWVIPRGGEYFFSPSISALRNTFSMGAHPSEL